MTAPASRARFRHAVALWIAIGCPSPALAQGVRTPNQSERGRLELSGTVAGSVADVTVVTCCGLRTPPTFSVTDETFATMAVGAAARFYWTEGLSAAIDVAWNRPASRSFTYPPPLTIPPAVPPFRPSAVVGRATERGGWTMSVGPGMDLTTRGRWRPWVGGELVVEHIAETYQQRSLVYADSIGESLFEQERSETVVAAAVVGGLKVIVGPRMFLAADGTIRRSFTGPVLSFSPFRWRVGVGVRLRADR